MPFTLSARVMQTPAPDRLEILDHAVIAVADEGTIAAVEAAGSDVGRELVAVPLTCAF